MKRAHIGIDLAAADDGVGVAVVAIPSLADRLALVFIRCPLWATALWLARPLFHISHLRHRETMREIFGDAADLPPVTWQQVFLGRREKSTFAAYSPAEAADA